MKKITGENPIGRYIMEAAVMEIKHLMSRTAGVVSAPSAEYGFKGTAFVVPFSRFFGYFYYYFYYYFTSVCAERQKSPKAA